MPKPEEVNPGNFDVHHIVYSHAGFSVAWGIFEDETPRIGMRWDGPEERPLGHPQVRGKPMWFMLPEELGVAMLALLRDRDGARHRELAKALVAAVDPDARR